MRQPDRLDSALVVGAAALGVPLVLVMDGGGPEWVFGSVCLAVLTLLVRTLAEGWRQASLERRVATGLAATQPSEVAREAVREERRRMSLDIVRGLRAHLEDVGSMAREAHLAGDPTATLSRIHRSARGASSELRRELGLLREDAAPADEPRQPIAAAPSRAQVLLAVAVTVLALVESVAYSRADGTELSWLSLVLTGAAAAAIVLRRWAPGIGAAWVGVVYLFGAALDAPVQGGFWFLVTAGGLAWATLSRSSYERRDLAGAATMCCGVGLGTWRADPDNLAVDLLVIAVGAIGGLLAGVAQRRFRSARVESAQRTALLADAAGVAVEAERAVFARDLHDVVSHAVGLVAVQASAALVSWPDDPAAVFRALDVIEETARSTLGELDRLEPDVAAWPKGRADLEELLGRVRAAGTEVDLDCSADLVGPTGETVYRVVQEGLTNVVRHAPGARATVSVTGDAEGVTVRVEDDGPGVGDESLRGFGLTGLAERVGFAGGTFECGDGPQGGFSVLVHLPSAPEMAVS